MAMSLQRKLSSESVTSSSTSAGGSPSTASSAASDFDEEWESSVLVEGSSPEVLAPSAARPAAVESSATAPPEGAVAAEALWLPELREELLLGDGTRLARGCAALLGRAVAKGEGGGAASLAFHAAHAPVITLQDYATRLVRLLRCSPACLPLALLLLDRAARLRPGFGLDVQSCHMLLLTSLVVAAKSHDDDFYSNTFYATIGGIQVRELNRMELELLKILGFALYVQPEEFAAYARLCHVAASEQL